MWLQTALSYRQPFILKNGGLGKGALNFDAKVRRESFEPEDIFHSHISGMDSFAIGLKVVIEDRVLDRFILEHYSSFTKGIGLDIVEGKTNFHQLEANTYQLTEFKNQSDRTERLKALVNQ
jgi:xylose isomerase